MSGKIAGIVLGLGMVVSCMAQQGGGWVVKQEWVRAHEEFLASDVMAGRGSATRDEEITATYVASEFMAYGLKPAPGMSGYIQSAEVVAPQLDGKATLTVGSVMLREGQDFQLLTSSAEATRGTLKKVAAVDAGQAEVKGAVVLLTGDPKTALDAANGLVRRGATAVLVVQSGASDELASMFGGKTQVRMRLAESKPTPGRTLVALTAEAVNRLAEEGNAKAELAVHVLPEGNVRRTFNAIGYLEGSDPSDGTILLTAHLDHLGVGRPVNGDSIFNGANDDAAGTAAVLELAHALGAGPKLRRNVLFVCYGSEEAGTLGSTYFGQHSPVPLKSLVANLEFEMIGTQDPKMPKGVLLLTGWERSNLGPTLKEHGALLGPDPYPEQHFFQRSDNYALALKGVVAHTAAGWGTPPTYHQPSDDLAHLDIAFMTGAIQSLVEPVRWLAQSDFRPKWNEGGQPVAGSK
ncbi:M28 family peptidase [Granulicella sibirica]|uniref:Putative peptidase, M28 family protein n=1 Tax=Granulicella sibirica TaxID=2479048 RepID=A0A4Q0T1S5_9BACT|nr:M28 family peptidase [Granulicella sibirica]RXH57127.1 putative peptidase, M28 family protein [Granulicella sibirica]